MSNNCHVEPITKTALDHVLRSADRVVLSVLGMGCQNCATRVRNGLLSLDGVHEVEIVDLMMADVYFDEKKITHDMLVKAVARAGNDGRHNYLATVTLNG